VQPQEGLLEKRITIERKKLTLQERVNEEKSQLHKEKEQLLAEKLKVHEMVHRALRSVAVIK
jgi:hypothetical protein